jgi:putative endopeptidase
MRHSRCFTRLALALLAVLPSTLHAAAAHRAIDPADRDMTCSPCRDFYQYANGGWIARTPLPPAYPRYGSFTALSDHNQDVVHHLLEDAVQSVTRHPGTTMAKLGLYYGSCMDSARAESEGAKPIAPELARIDAIANTGDLTAEIARLHAMFVPARGERSAPLFSFGANQDAKHSTEVIAVAGQGGLGFPDRDYYTKSDSASKALRERYVAHIAKTFELLRESTADAGAHAGQVMGIETALAQASMTNVQRRDPNAVYHKMTVAELAALAPTFDWNRYLQLRGIPDVTSLNVSQPDFMRTMGSMLKDVPLDAWKAYLRWEVVSEASPLLSSAFVNEDFAFRRLLTGAREMQPRWKRCLVATDAAMGQALGEEYVRRTFTPAAKARALAMVTNLEAVLHDRIAALEWMGDSTRARALAKLEAFGNKIGYPDKWRDYSALRLERGPFVANRWRVLEFENQYNMAKVSKPFDRTDWRFTVPTVNASYSPSGNEITFPAGILQPPFFDPAADDAVNYGGIGCVIGHEMTHGFDDQGRQFDKEGNLQDWWTADDAARFKVRADRVADQFDSYVAVGDVHVNGHLTLGENLADLGGIAVAYAALERSLQGKSRTLIDGLTPEQRFFISYAQIWRELTRPENVRTQVATNPHSPGHFRVIGPLSNLPEFARAFGCKPGDAMVRPDSLQARIW